MHVFVPYHWTICGRNIAFKLRKYSKSVNINVGRRASRGDLKVGDEEFSVVFAGSG